MPNDRASAACLRPHRTTRAMTAVLVGIACLSVAVIALRVLSKPDEAEKRTATTDDSDKRPPEAIAWDVMA